jgi:uncharacterized membrane protein YeaQ/YmgE (transglycosylase-associated protein family)
MPWFYPSAATTFSGVLFMSILTWIIVGLIAGVLASLVMGGTGYGIIGDIIVGIVGAFIGGWLFTALGVAVPLGGIAGTILVAFIGAIVLLFIIRLIRRGTTRTV